MKSIRSHTLFALVSIATVAGAHAVFAATEVREEFHQTYPLDKQGKVQLENVNGNVRIGTWDREEIKVEAIKRARKQEHLDEVKIEVDAKADGIRIKTKLPDSKAKRNKNNSTSVDYTLTVPQHSRLDRISTVNGGIEIEKVNGDVEARSVNGSLTATGLVGNVELSTVNGSVKASFAEVKKAVVLKSVNGGVTIALAADAQADVSANTVNGGISSDFSLQAKKHFPIGQSLDGKLGEGGPGIKMSTVNGGIRIDRSKAVALDNR
ncbi:MAG TPA: hypothetical protein VGK57_05165 [Candidatus Binatia bacterium]